MQCEKYSARTRGGKEICTPPNSNAPTTPIAAGTSQDAMPRPAIPASPKRREPQRDKRTLVDQPPNKIDQRHHERRGHHGSDGVTETIGLSLAKKRRETIRDNSPTSTTAMNQQPYDTRTTTAGDQYPWLRILQTTRSSKSTLAPVSRDGAFPSQR